MSNLKHIYEEKTKYTKLIISTSDGMEFFVNIYMMCANSKIFNDVLDAHPDTQLIHMCYEGRDILQWLKSFHGVPGKFTELVLPTERIGTYLQISHAYSERLFSVMIDRLNSERKFVIDNDLIIAVFQKNLHIGSRIKDMIYDKLCAPGREVSSRMKYVDSVYIHNKYMILRKKVACLQIQIPLCKNFHAYSEEVDKFINSL